MKKTALFTLGLLMAASACFADAKVEVKDVDAGYLQKYVMDNFYTQNPQYTLESKTAEKVVYFKKQSLVKKDVVIGTSREEVIFTTVQQGEDVVLGIEQNKIDTMKDGKVETKKNSDDLQDKIFLNEYRSFFNDTYQFGFTPERKAGKEGLGILSVYGFGPMHDAGIKNGDVIVAINGAKAAEHVTEIQYNLLPDKFAGAPVTFTIKQKSGVKDVVLTPTMQECKYTKIKQARARAEKERAEGKRGIESWLKL